MNQSEHNTALLALSLRMSRNSHNKPIFWLGAGCSLHDGVPLSAELLRQLVPTTGFWGSPQYVFDQHYDNLRPSRRATELARLMNKPLTPDSPYRDLAYLLKEGYADLVFTFNIDHLLEASLKEAGLVPETDYLVIDVPKTKEVVVSALVEQPGRPRIRVVKLHGDYQHGINYMTSREIAEYNPDIVKIVQRYSQESAVVCGYSFFHLNVLTAFSRTGGALYYGNCAFPDAPMVLSLISLRSGFIIDGEHGKFEILMKALRKAL